MADMGSQDQEAAPSQEIGIDNPGCVLKVVEVIRDSDKSCGDDGHLERNQKQSNVESPEN